MVCCKDCEHFKLQRRSETIPSSWVTVESGTGFGTVISCWSGYTCHHQCCFTEYKYTDPVNGTRLYRNRTSGHAVINKNNDCGYFKQKLTWWRFW